MVAAYLQARDQLKGALAKGIKCLSVQVKLRIHVSCKNGRQKYPYNEKQSVV